MLEVQLDVFQTAAYDLVKPGRVCVFPLGRGTGKTYLGRYLIHDKALSTPGTHVGLLMPSLKQARAVFWPGLMADYHALRGALDGAPNKTELTANYSNGSRLTTWGAENAQSIRGQRFDVLIQDESDDIDLAVEAQVVEPTFSRSGYAYGLAILTWLLYNGAGIWKHGLIGYLKHTCIPAGVKGPVLLLIVPLEFLSNILVRPVTLALRLFANMFAGHLLLVLFAVGGEYLIIESPSLVNVFGGVLAWVMFFAVSVLELLVMFLQAYVFTLLTAMYVGGALADEH